MYTPAQPGQDGLQALWDMGLPVVFIIGAVAIAKRRLAAGEIAAEEYDAIVSKL